MIIILEPLYIKNLLENAKNVYIHMKISKNTMKSKKKMVT